ncbi:Beta-phosphoglucomutase [Candidatus Ornithobacterium hominis]|uniref:Beta-phosphoglucomutase n=1 Tax=Candidatus Ornithobacterium hominis TaxID=2497989 RepID=A0A383TZH7_9FLAO|nr:HAD family phosphatase [Candidatus Ornithobacterium hominis]MCT7904328.1 HAD family phosphatase [Candidatus Ornithobacterium hominis]SZD73005.1 Beta-phosphoglucomutase [Candidatus Ornithobacterium hominis]
MLKAVLFDMDGVIVDTEPLHRKAYYSMFDDFNIEVSEELFQTFTGKSTQHVCETLIDKFGLKNQPQELINVKRKFFKHLFDNDPNFDLIPGVLDLIKNLYQNNITLILASSASMNTINWVFEKFELTPYFTDKISGASLKESKPHPEIFEIAAKLAKAQKSECIVIEDSTSGLKAAHAAEIYAVAYRSKNSRNQDYSLAKTVISDFSEIDAKKLNGLIAKH